MMDRGTVTLPPSGALPMLSSLQDFAVFLDASPAGERIGRQAARLARQHGAHLIGIYGVSRQQTGPAGGMYVRGQALQEVIDRRRRSDEEQVLEAGRCLAALSREYGVSSEFRVVWKYDDDEQAPLRNLHCDLLVSAHPPPDGLPDGWSGEALLRSTGIPVLLLPASWDNAEVGQHVLIAWNRSREARRAVGDALPFIHRAKRVTVLAVDNGRAPSAPLEAPGSHLAEHLGRHGIEVELAQVDAGGRPVAEVILAEAGARGADLLVAGAYSRARAAQLLFGGTTRSLLADAALPLLMSR